MAKPLDKADSKKSAHQSPASRDSSSSSNNGNGSATSSAVAGRGVVPEVQVNRDPARDSALSRGRGGASRGATNLHVADI